MAKHAFIGSKARVKQQVKNFIATTQVDELIVLTNVFSAEVRMNSYKQFAKIMRELNAEDWKFTNEISYYLKQL